MKHHIRIRIKNKLRKAGVLTLSISFISTITGQLGVLGEIERLSHFLTNATGYTIQPRHFSLLLSVTAGAGIALFIGSYFVTSRKFPKGSIKPRRFNAIEDLRILYQFLDHYADTSLVPIDIRVEMMKKNSDCFWMIEEHRFDGSMRSVGVLMIFPLNKRASESVRLGTLTGYDIRADHIVAKRGIPRGCYIGFVWAIDSNKAFKPYSGEVIRISHGILLRAIRNASHPMIFARPTTRNALAVAKRFGFRSLNSSSAIKLDEVACLQGKLGRLPK
ncbi:MAG TPA: hypothetical protein VNP98_02015 [Chthoniobacterales bacterium]|nr:hypothetical protein [Chthoniobacterales bacterium]